MRRGKAPVGLGSTWWRWWWQRNYS